MFSENYLIKIKNQKGFIQIPMLIAIIVGFLVIGGVSYVSIKQYKNYKAHQAEIEKAAQEKERQNNEDRQKQNLIVENLKKEVETLKNKKPEIIQQTVIKEVPVQKADLATIVKEWRPLMAYVVCEWDYVDGTQQYLGGSGMLIKFNGSPNYSIETNRHVILDSNNQFPNNCTIKLLDDINSIVIHSDSTRNPFWTLTGPGVQVIDAGDIEIFYPDEYLKNLVPPPQKFCAKEASIGDSVLILGFPGIGSQTDITATEGIISGRDGYYYITSAKVEHGNSGGAAILVNDDCYLGIPSFAKTGSIESLSRILDVQVEIYGKR